MALSLAIKYAAAVSTAAPALVACGERCVRRAGRRHRPPAAASLRRARLAGALRNSLRATRFAQTAAVKMLTKRATRAPASHALLRRCLHGRPGAHTAHREMECCLWRCRKTETAALSTALRAVHAGRDAATRGLQFPAPQALPFIAQTPSRSACAATGYPGQTQTADSSAATPQSRAAAMRAPRWCSCLRPRSPGRSCAARSPPGPWP
jgi:hypothetical protein